MDGVFFMAENKKSFILYCDLIHTVSKMPDDKAGQLFKHILSYVNDLNPQTDDLITQLTFEPVKQQLKRDLQKYQAISGERSEDGRLGGIKSGEARRTKSKQKEAIALKSKQKEHDTVNDNDTVNVKDKKEVCMYRSFLHLAISDDEFGSLREMGFAKSQIDLILDAIQNYKKNTNYKSLFLTAKQWLIKEHGNPEDKPKPPQVTVDFMRYDNYPEYVKKCNEVNFTPIPESQFWTKPY